VPIYESEVIIPPFAGLQKPGAARYAFAADTTRMLQERLQHTMTVKATWTDGNRLAVQVTSEERLTQDAVSHVDSAIRSLLGTEVQMGSLMMAADDET
jgi:hypothetical protein